MRPGDPVFVIPNASCIGVGAKSITCLIDPRATKLTYVPLKMLSTQSEVRNVGDHGRLIVSAWWAELSRPKKYLAELVGAEESGAPAAGQTRRVEGNDNAATREYRDEK